MTAIPRYLVAAYRSPFLLLAVLDGSAVIITEQIALTADTLTTARVTSELFNLARDYDIDRVVLDADWRLETPARVLGAPIELITLDEAKALLLPHEPHATHRALYEHLIERRPKLKRLVATLPMTGRVSLSVPRQQLSLLAVALGLAAEKRRLLDREDRSY